MHPGEVKAGVQAGACTSGTIHSDQCQRVDMGDVSINPWMETKYGVSMPTITKYYSATKRSGVICKMDKTTTTEEWSANVCCSPDEPWTCRAGWGKPEEEAAGCLLPFTRVSWIGKALRQKADWWLPEAGGQQGGMWSDRWVRGLLFGWWECPGTG